ncbi:MAG: hypothetical protein WD825_17705 [Gemmatimonadaceae bacterium]
MRRFLILALFVAVSTVSSEALAQGKGGGKPKAAPGQAKKRVTPSDAVVVTREILVKHGFQFVRVETVSGMQVVYFRRGNMGKGKGLGPVQKMVVRPSGDIVVFEGAPSAVLVDVRVRLGL